jgi:uncharacterized protein (DUF427 family)
MWTYRGQKRPEFAIEPGPGQESVWDYPRPPKIEPDRREIVVRDGNREIARTVNSLRVLETASPPTFYIPPEDADMDILVPVQGNSYCEWKGRAVYWALASSEPRGAVGWSYPDPTPPFRAIRDYLSFYPARVDCFVAGELVRPQPGAFYGGWITSEIVGPFKGEPGTEGW